MLGAAKILKRAAKGTSWSQFLDYASPALFDVLPLSGSLKQGREFVSNHGNDSRFAELKRRLSTLLGQRGVKVRLADQQTGPTIQEGELTADRRVAIGQHILELYFGQLFGDRAAILDLRLDTFSSDGDWLAWCPNPIYLDWDPDFLCGIRNLYGGFYLEDSARFETGLKQLQLEASGDALVRHLGSGDQRSVRFDTQAFHASFHETFLACQKAGVSLHRNFLGLGLYLVCLYEALERLDVAFDVRGAFEASHG